MANAAINQFVPDYAVHPGEILEEILEAQGISKSEFAERSGLTPKTISWIITGKNPVTSESAIVFERVLGIAAETWNNLDAGFRLFQARKKASKSLDGAIEWSKKFPLAELIKLYGFDCHQVDFMSINPRDMFDIILMNPPFEDRQDIAHIKRAYEWLNDGGELVAIASAGVQFRNDRLTAEFREWVDGLGGSIQALPEGSFKPSGTNVNTAIIKLTK